MSEEIKKEEPLSLSSRRGTFKLTRPLIICEPELVKELMGKMIILRCEFMFAEDKFEYDAVCDELFTEVPEGKDIPMYNIFLDDDKKNFKAEKTRRF